MNEEIREKIENIEYTPQAEGCRLEDRGINDRYEAMKYGWEQAMFKVLELLKE